MLFSCSVLYRATLSEDLFGQFQKVNSRKSECRMVQILNPLLTLELRQVASIPSDPPRHLALHNKHTSQRIRTKGFCMSASTLRIEGNGQAALHR